MVADGRKSMAQVFGAVLGQEVLAARNAGPGEMATLSHAAVVCSDDPVTSPDDMILPKGASRYARVFGPRILEQYMALCETVDVPTLPDDTEIDPFADVPTLVLSGWLDVRTPTGRSLEVAKALPNALLVTFWQGSHVQLGEANLCAAQIVRDFVADPPDGGRSFLRRRIPRPRLRAPGWNDQRRLTVTPGGAVRSYPRTSMAPIFRRAPARRPFRRRRCGACHGRWQYTSSAASRRPPRTAGPRACRPGAAEMCVSAAARPFGVGECVIVPGVPPKARSRSMRAWGAARAWGCP
jgi:hypothetical protein